MVYPPSTLKVSGPQGRPKSQVSPLNVTPLVALGRGQGLWGPQAPLGRWEARGCAFSYLRTNRHNQCMVILSPLKSSKSTVVGTASYPQRKTRPDKTRQDKTLTSMEKILSPLDEPSDLRNFGR